MLDMQDSAVEKYVVAEAEGRTFVYISEQYEGESVENKAADGRSVEVETADNKGKLFIAE